MHNGYPPDPLSHKRVVCACTTAIRLTPSAITHKRVACACTQYLAIRHRLRVDLKVNKSCWRASRASSTSPRLPPSPSRARPAQRPREERWATRAWRCRPRWHAGCWLVKGLAGGHASSARRWCCPRLGSTPLVMAPSTSLTSDFLPLTSYFSPLTSYFLLLTPYFLPLTLSA